MSPEFPVKNRLSWLVVLTLVLGSGALVAYYGWLHDWRGRFTPEQLSLEVQASGAKIDVVLRNNSPSKMIVFEADLLASPFEVSLTPKAGGAPIKPAPGAAGERSGHSIVLDPGKPQPWRVDLGELFPRLPPGGYTLRVAYDPAAAAARGEVCAEDLTLGRVEAQPVEVRIPASR
jgi:hypothetical protein